MVAEHGQLVVKSAVAHLHDLDDDLKTPSLFLAKVKFIFDKSPGNKELGSLAGSDKCHKLLLSFKFSCAFTNKDSPSFQLKLTLQGSS